MKRISMCRLFLSYLSILLIVATCRQSEDQEPIPEALVRSQTRSASEIPGLLNAIAPYVNPALGDRGDISAANQANTYFGMSIDLEFIKSRIDSSDYTNYSMLLRDGVSNPRVIKNLVIGQDADGQWKTPMLMTYTMSEEFYEQYRDTGSLEGFTGTISKEQLRPLSYQTQQSNREPADNEEDPDDYGSDRDRPDTTCPLETTVTSGGGATLVSDTYVEICEVFIVTVYSTDGHGNRYIHDQYLTYENCRIEEEYSNSDTENCEEPIGEIPINAEDENLPPDCESFRYIKTTDDAEWQEAAIRGIYFNVVLIDGRTGRVTGMTRITYHEPVWFGVPTEYSNGRTLPAGRAATMSAAILNQAMSETADHFYRTRATTLQVKNHFREVLQEIFEAAEGRVNFNYQNGSPLVVPTQYETRIVGIGDCG